MPFLVWFTLYTLVILADMNLACDLPYQFTFILRSVEIRWVCAYLYPQICLHILLVGGFYVDR